MGMMLDHFPTGQTPRQNQVEVIRAIEKAFKEGYRNVLLESPVGSGKSMVALTVADYLGNSHILTPRKSLQDQYLEDFSYLGDVALMKGRSSYPCTFLEEDFQHSRIISKIYRKEPIYVSGQDTCSGAPCQTKAEIKNKCLQLDPVTGQTKRQCPYSVAANVAEKSEKVVHNLHSFIFQSSYAEYFGGRRLMAVDECHEIENIVRDLSILTLSIPTVFEEELERSGGRLKTLNDWGSRLLDFASMFSETRVDKFGVSDKDRFIASIQKLFNSSAFFGEDFISDIVVDRLLEKTSFSFIPLSIGRQANSFILDFGEKRLLMSGTIYDKAVFCRTNGLNLLETCFIRIGSSFPKENRPIYTRKTSMLDLSHRMWDENFGKMVDNLRRILAAFGEVKGLIHTPSYMASEQIAEALLDTGRIVTHTRDNVSQRLQDFYAMKGAPVFLSPVCQQGVDFKDDRARFQVILRVPYLNTSSKFVEHQVKNNFAWYNYQALVIFGQQIGRIVRSESDWGHTILMDERFNSFLYKNRNVLPKWVNESIRS